MELDMTKGKPLPVILKFTIPLIIGNIFQQLYNMADMIIVGRYLGAGALAAVGATGTITFLIIGFSQGITAGFTILTAQRYGAKDGTGVRRSVANGILLSAGIGLFLTVFSTAAVGWVLKLMNTPEDIYRDAYVYISIICAGLIANIFYNLFSSYLRAVGNSRIPLYILVFSAVLNVALDVFFIVKLSLGVAGAALATVLSQAVSAGLCGIYILKRVRILKPDRDQWRFSSMDTRSQLAAGLPMAFQFSITASGGMVMQAAINMFGSTAVAAFTAGTKLQNFVTQAMVALGQTMATYAGQNYGSGDVGRIKAGVRTGVIVEVTYAVFAMIFMNLALEPAIHLFFIGDADFPSILPWAQTYARICSLFFVPLSVIFVFRNTMQGCGYGFLPMMGGVVELFARVFTGMAAIRLFSYPLACFCDPAAWMGAGIFTGISYLFVIRKIEKQLKKEGQAAA